MRRHGNLWEQITSEENIRIAYDKAKRNKPRLRGAIIFAKNHEENLAEIRRALLDKTFSTSQYMEKIVYEPKKRTIYVLPFSPDRIVQHAVMNVLIPIWEKLFMGTSKYDVGLPPHIGGIAIADKNASSPVVGCKRGKASKRGEGGQHEYGSKEEQKTEAGSV